MEFLDLSFDEMTQLEKTSRAKFDFPVVHFIKGHNVLLASFNKACTNKFKNARYIRIYGNAEYIVFSPTDVFDPHGFKVTYNHKVNSVVSARSLERFAVEGKTYKLYQTQKGFAIKLSEPILNRKE
jgi:hypothetical protein